MLDSPEQRAELEHFLTGLHGLYGLPLRLAVMPANYGYAAASNAGAALARAKHIAFVNSDIVPDRPGWLLALHGALEASADVGAVGPKLLFEDDSLQHAGLYFGRDPKGRWFNHHYFKGYPRDFAPANIARAVPGVTGAVLMIKRDVYEKIGRFSEDFVIGDYEDSDLCLKIRKAGMQIRYVPQAELYHFERRSIQQHAGYMRGIASELNRLTHATRWGGFIDEVMKSFEAPAKDKPAAVTVTTTVHVEKPVIAKAEPAHSAPPKVETPAAPVAAAAPPALSPPRCRAGEDGSRARGGRGFARAQQHGCRERRGADPDPSSPISRANPRSRRCRRRKRSWNLSRSRRLRRRRSRSLRSRTKRRLVPVPAPVAPPVAEGPPVKRRRARHRAAAVTRSCGASAPRAARREVRNERRPRAAVPG